MHEQGYKQHLLFELGSLGVETDAHYQVLTKVIQGQTFDGMGVDPDLLGPPLKAVSVGIREALTPTENEETDERDVAVTEVLVKSLRLLEIVE